MIISGAMLCMAITIYHEARGEPLSGQYAVAQVLWNRSARDRSQVCTEAFKPKQFSWANVGVKPVKAGWKLAQRHHPAEHQAWMRAQSVARTVLTYQNLPDFTAGQANHYHAVSVRPSWRLSMEKTTRIGRHVFYFDPRMS